MESRRIEWWVNYARTLASDSLDWLTNGICTQQTALVHKLERARAAVRAHFFFTKNFFSFILII